MDITYFNNDVKSWLEMNAKLQQKKRALRKELSELGVQKKEGRNDYDRYNYFSEAQYKELFTKLFSKHGLELKFTELEYGLFDGSEKQSNGRMPRLEFRLFDTETGFYEATVITGEGMDKGDKAGYKAYTGALKYYLADTFMVATGDDPEKDSPETPMNKKSERKASPKQVEYLTGFYKGDLLDKLLAANGITKIEDISMSKASELITKIQGKKGEQ